MLCAPISTAPHRSKNRVERRPDMTTQGIGAVFVETQNWGRAAKFFQSLGYSIDFATDHNSGLLRNGDGPYVFVVEVPADRQPQTRIALTVDDADAFQADPTLDVVTPF